MSALLAILSVGGAIALLVVRSLAVDEIKGRLQRRITASVEATIDALPEELQAEWADEWRAELATVISMPLTATQFARGVRVSAHELVGARTPAPAAIDNHMSTLHRSTQGTMVPRTQRALRGLLHQLGYLLLRYGDWIATHTGLVRVMVSAACAAGAVLATLGFIDDGRVIAPGATIVALGTLFLIISGGFARRRR